MKIGHISFFFRLKFGHISHIEDKIILRGRKKFTKIIDIPVCYTCCRMLLVELGKAHLCLNFVGSCQKNECPSDELCAHISGETEYAAV